MSSQTVVDVIISGTTATVVDARVDGITTVAGAPPITNVSGQIPDLGVTTNYLAGQGEILSLTNDVVGIRANVIITGQTLTNEIGVLSGALISTGNYLESNVLTLSGDLIASGNNLDSLRDILSGNLITTGRVLEEQLQNNDLDISALQTATGALQDQKFDKAGGILSGDIIPDSSGTLTLGTASFPFKSGFFDDLTVSTNTLFVGEIPIKGTDTGGLDFEEATGTTFFKDVSIRNLTVTGTETIIDVDNLAIKDNKIIINSGEKGAGISLVTGGIIIDRGTLTDADLLFNEATDRFEFNFPLALDGNLVVTANQTGVYADAGNLITTGQALTSEINTVSGLITSNDGEITELKTATGILKTFTDDNAANLITTGQTLTTNINTVSTNLISTGSVVDDISGNLITTGQTLTSEIGTVSGLITDNDGDITALKTATGVLKTSTDANTSNLITTGNFLTSEINIVSGLAGGSVIDELSGNLITTGQTLQVQITSNDSDISTLTSNLVTTGQTLTSEIAIVSGIAEAHTDVTALSGKVDDISGNLIATGQTLQTQITSNDGDISTLTSNLITTGQTLTSEIIIVSGLTTGSASDPALSGKVDTLSGNLITTGQTLTTDINAVSSNLITTGQTLQTQITSNDTDISNLTSNVITTGQTLTSEIAIVSGIAESHTDVTALSGKVDDISGNLITTGQTLQTQITSNDGDITTLTSNLITTGQTLTSEIAIVSGIATGGSAEDFAALSGDLITTGQTLQTQITSNDSDISTLTSNLITTGQTLTTDINTVSTNLISTGAVVDDISGNLITTGQTLQTQITSNDSDISTLTSNLISTGSVVDDVSGNLITTGQTLTTSINTNSSNLITTGQTLTSEIAIVSGIAEAHTDVSALSGKVDDISGNLITTGQTLTTNINTVSTNLITTGQTLTTSIDTVSSNLVSTGTIVDDISGNLITTGQTLQTQITSNDGDITSLTSNLITTGQTLTSEIGTVSGLITDNDAEITALLAATGELKTDTNTNASNLITTGQTLTTNINTVSTNLVSTGSIVDDISGNLITTGQTLQTQITSNDGDITNLTSNLITTGQTLTTEITTVSGLITDNDGDITALKAATGVLKTSTDNNTANLISTGAIVDDISGNLITSGQTLQTQITSNDSDISTLTANVITTGQTLQTQITSNDGDISTLTSNLITTGQTLQTQITSNDGDISTLTSNLISTGSVVDDISGNLITTGQTLQTQITSNDSDISTLTSNLVTTGQTLTTNINTVSSNLVSTGSVVDDISGNLITTGQTLQTQITSNDGDISTLTTDLGTTGQTLQTQITSNDADIATLDSTTVKLTTNQSVAGNKIFTDTVTINNLTVTGTEVIVDVENLAVKDNIIHINSGESGAGISRISGGITIDRGTEPAANILYNDANDRFELNFPLATEGNVVASAANLITTGQTLQTQITSNDGDITTLTTNLVTTGQTLQTQITSNDSDISTLTSNLSTTNSNLVTTGQTLTTNINTVSTNLVSTGSIVDDISGNLITTGQTLQTQITSNDTDITNLSSNLVTTGQTLTTNIDTVATNLVTTGQTLTSEIATVSGLIPATVIDGGGTANKVPLWSDANTIGDSVISQSSSKIGIGTATPEVPLEVVFSRGAKTSLTDIWGLRSENTGDVAGTQAGLTFIVNNASSARAWAGIYAEQTNTDDTSLKFWNEKANSRTVKMTINSDGNVGIGSENPAYKLDVRGDYIFVDDGKGIRFGGSSHQVTRETGNELRLKAANTTGFITFLTGGGTEYMRIAADGKVGIGTTAPAALLDVRGTVKVGVDDAGHDVMLYGATSGRYWEWDQSMDLVRMRDNVKSVYGNGDDLQIYHDGSNSYITDSGTGDLKLLSSGLAIQSANGNEYLAYFAGTGGQTVSLYAGNSKKFETTSTGVSVTGQLDLSSHLDMPDNAWIKLGASDDLLITHDGSSSWIIDNGAGGLVIASDSFYIKNAAYNETGLSFIENGAVSLYYDNAVKLATTSTGVTVTGALKTTTILDTNNSAGTNGQVLVSTGAAIDWKTLAEISGVDGSGTAGYLSKWADTDTIGNSPIYTDGTDVAIGSTAFGVGGTQDLSIGNPGTTTGGITLWSTTSGSHSLGFGDANSGTARYEGYVEYSHGDNSMRLATSHAERMRITSGGNFGINCTNPATRFVVQHTDGGTGIEFSMGASLSYIQCYSRSASDYKDLKIDAENLLFGTNNGTERMRITSAGNVGIGTTAPSADLEVSTASGGEFLVTRSGNSGVTLQQVNGGDATSGSLSIKAGTAMVLYTNGTGQAVYINSSQNVGLGVVPESDWDSAHTALQIGLTSSIISGTASTGWTQLMKNARYVGGGVYKYITTDEASRYNQKDDGTHHFDVAASGTADAAISWTTALSIINSGNVGIGTNAPIKLFHVKKSVSGDFIASIHNTNSAGWGTFMQGGGDSGDYSLLVRNQASSDLFSIMGDGEIRVAGQTLVDNANTNYKMTFPDNSGIAMGSAYTFANIYGNAGNIYLRANAYPANTGSTSKIYLQTANSSGGQAADVVVNNGQVGIGTTSPSSALNLYEVAGIDNKLRFHNSTTGTGTSNGSRIGLNGDELFINNLEASTIKIYTQSTQTNGITIVSDGKVGIGTVTPGSYDSRAERLVVHESGDGGITIATGATSDGRLVFARSGDTGLDHGEISYDQNTDHMGFATAGSRRVTIDANGDVGIGGTPVNSPLNVFSDGGANCIRLIGRANGTTDESCLSFMDNDNSTENCLILNVGKDLAFHTNSAERMRLNSSGKFGIGTTTPLAKLDIKGDTTTWGGMAKVYLTDTSGHSASRNWSIGNGGTGYGDLNFIVSNALNGVPADSTGTAALVIKNDGKVGIGTIAPEGRVDVQMKMSGVDWTYGNWGEVWDSASQPGSKFNDCVFHIDTNRGGGVTGGIVGLAFSPGWQGHQNWGIYSTNESGGSWTQGDLRFVNQINNGTIIERVTFKADGNVGIGTTSPAQLLHVHKASGDAAAKISCSGHARLILATTGTTDHASVDFGDSGGDVRGRILYANTGDYMKFETNGSERMRVTSDGTLDLISAKFKINGSAGSSGQSLTTDGNGNISWATSSGSGTISGSGTDNYVPRFNGTTALQNSAIFSNDSNQVGIRTTTFGSNSVLEIYKASGNHHLRLKAADNASCSLAFQNATGNEVYCGMFGDQSGGINKFGIYNAGMRLVADNAGKVGIGTNTPYEVLHINKANDGGDVCLRIQNADSGNSTDETITIEFVQTGSGADGGRIIAGREGLYTHPWSNADSFLAFYTALNNADTERMRITSAGKVGIGTTAPSRLFNAYSGSDDTAWIRATYGTTTMCEIGAHSAAAYLQSGSGDDIRIAPAGGTKLIVKVDGKIGIGTIAPFRKFHVYATGDQSNENNGAFWIGDSTTNKMGLYGGVNNTNNYSYIGSVRASQAYEDLILNPNGGKVGIVCTSPAYQLSVGNDNNGLHTDNGTDFSIGQYGSSANILALHSAGDMWLNIDSNGNDTTKKLYIAEGGLKTAASAIATFQQDGKVGIGTASPATTLHVWSGGPDFGVGLAIQHDTSYAGRYATLSFGAGSYRKAAIAIASSGDTNGTGDLIFCVDPTDDAAHVSVVDERMRITSAGNVGIGTTAPTSYSASTKALHVLGTNAELKVESNNGGGWAFSHYKTPGASWLVGSDDSDIFRISNVSNLSDARLTILGDGNVGIGIAAPLDLLHLAAGGKMRIAKSGDASRYTQSEYAGVNTNANDGYSIKLGGTTKYKFINDKLGIGSTSPAAPLDVPRASDYKVIKLGDDITSHYVMTGNSDHTLTLTCASYFQAEIVITAHQTNGGTYNNLYMRGIWSNNHTSHHWDEIENVGDIEGSTFTITVGQNGATTNSGEWKIVHDYTSGSFVKFTVRVTDFYNTHSYTIS